MSAFELKIKLKQQTPYIHFQHDQPGAILRASEVKPKLDKFILKKLEEEKIPLDDSWLVKKSREEKNSKNKNDNEKIALALDYKLRFFAQGTPVVSKAGDFLCEAIGEEDEDIRDKKLDNSKKAINGMYFGNMVSIKKEAYSGDELKNKKSEIKATYKETVYYSEPITAKIICFNQKLLEFIKNSIVEFFVVHNFGCRQSKGFGGFIVEEINGADIHYNEVGIRNCLGNRMYFYACTKENGHIGLLNHAMVIYGILKGGFNFTKWDETNRCYKKIRDKKSGMFVKDERYIKGYIQRTFFKDAEKTNTGSEKAFIKSMKPPINPIIDQKREANDSKDKKYDKYEFTRIMLGMADKYKFTGLRKGEVNVYNFNSKEDSFGIVRFKSPITIKIIKGFILFIIDEKAFEIIKNKKFYLLDTSRLRKSEMNALSNGAFFSKKDLITEKGWEIYTPATFGEKETKVLIQGFVKYFNEEKSKLKAFSTPYKDSISIELISGVSEDVQ